MRMVRLGALAVLALAVAGVWTVASGQAAVTGADIQRLQDAVYDAGPEVAQLRVRDAELAARLQADLDEIREEVIYLKVKLRKEGSLARSEYAQVRDRLDDLRSRAHGRTGGVPRSETQRGAGTASPAPRPAAPPTGSPASTPATTAAGSRPAGTSGRANTVPVGTELDVRLQSTLNSGTAQVEDRFEATTVVDLQVERRTLVPAGSVLRGVVSSVDRASRTDRTGSLTVSFDQITINGRAYPIRGTVTQALESGGLKGEAGRIGAGAGVGAIIGGILGGLKGALAGILIGAGGTVAATEGKDVNLPAGTILRVRLDTPLVLR